MVMWYVSDQPIGMSSDSSDGVPRAGGAQGPNVSRQVAKKKKVESDRGPRWLVGGWAHGWPDIRVERPTMQHTMRYMVYRMQDAGCSMQLCNRDAQHKWKSSV